MTRDEVLARAAAIGAGGMVARELAFLYDACAGKDVLELGSMIGQSSYVLAKTARRLTCVDAWIDHCPFLEPRQAKEYKIAGMEAVFDANMAGLEFRKIKAKTSAASKLLSDETFDAVLIDADHSCEAVLSDITNFRCKVRPGGLLLLHDYNSQAWTGVRQAADLLLTGRTPHVIAALGIFTL